MSIWGGLDRTSIEHQIKKLEEEAPVQDIASLTSLVSSPSQSVQSYPIYFLPISVEAQLTTYFSFIAAWTNHPRDVAATTLQHNVHPDFLLLSLAANEGVQQPVEMALHNLVGVLQKIFWRLGSKKAQGQRNDKAWPGVAARIKELRTVKLKPLMRRPGDATTLSDQILDLETKIETAEQCIPATEPGCGVEEVEALEAVIHAAYEISSDNRTIITRLRHLHIPTNRREYRYIQVLSNYWTISLYLSKVALHYYRWFTKLTLRCLALPPKPEDQGADYCVHAEIQLLLDHERHVSAFAPRYISSNKQPCFLCYCFIRAHGTYLVSGSHGHVHHQWAVTLPPDMDPARQAKLHEALRITAADVATALQNAPTTRAARYIDPAQSVLNLVDDANQVRSPSQSTLASPIVQATQSMTARALGSATEELRSQLAIPTINPWALLSLVPRMSSASHPPTSLPVPRVSRTSKPPLSRVGPDNPPASILAPTPAPKRATESKKKKPRLARSTPCSR
nr:hypothetical protein CFP56_29941 [Quercus suber]